MSRPLNEILRGLEKYSFSEISSRHKMIAEEIQPAMSQLTPSDLSLGRLLKDDGNLFTYYGNRKTWLYYPIKESREFTLAVFALPKGRFLPLHDHPDMSVVFKCVWGDLEVEEWQSGSHHADLLRMSPSSYASVVHGIHSIKAIEHSAFIDLVLPPYDNNLREITYFEKPPDSKLKVLQEPPFQRSIRMQWPEED